MNNMNKNCLKCSELQKIINGLKRENIDLKDHLLISKQENIALNNVRIKSIKCIDILNTIVHKLSISYQKDSEAEVIEQNHVKSGQNEANVESLKSDYKTNYSQLNVWFEQLDVIKTITKFPRFNVTKHEEEEDEDCDKDCDEEKKPSIRRSSRVSLPVDHFSAFGQTIVKNEKGEAKRSDETPTLGSSKRKSSDGNRLRCPFPGCGFFTRRGVIGMKEHSKCHTRNYNQDNETKPLVPYVNLSKPKSKGRTILRCSYPQCLYTTRYGMYHLRRHIKSIHTKVSANKSSNSSPKIVIDMEQLSEVNDKSASKPKQLSEVNDIDMKQLSEVNDIDMKQLSKVNDKSVSKTAKRSKTWLRCSYDGCTYSTRWGMSKLRLHMRIHMSQRNAKPKPLSSFVFNMKTQNTTKSSDKRLGTLLRCSQCNYKTKWGLGTLRKHMIIHNREQPFKCDKCDASYKSLYPLLNHKKQNHQKSRTVHNKSDKYSCVLCNKTFKDSYNVKRHMKNVHFRKDDSYECPHEDCFFRTNIIEILQKHVVTHILTKNEIREQQKVVKDVSIEIQDSDSCDSITTFPSLQPIEVKLEKHSEEKETELIPIEIPEKFYLESVNDSSSRKSNDSVLFNFGSHLMKKFNKNDKTKKSSGKKSKSKTKNKSIEEMNGETSAQSDTPLANRLMQTIFKSPTVPLYQCDGLNCSFSSSNAEEWIKHNDKHEKEDEDKHKDKRFKCDHCKKAFTKVNRLEAHKRLKRHFMHMCSYINCGKEYRTIQLLEKHEISIHGSQKSLSILDTPAIIQQKLMCQFPDCNKSFAKEDYRRKHMRNVHCLRIAANKSTTPSETIPRFQSPAEEQNPTLVSMLRSEIVAQDFNSLADNSIFNSSLIRCPIISCNETFSLKDRMITHFNHFHKAIESPDIVNITDESTRCSECGQLFTTPANMRRHKTLAHKKSNNTIDEMLSFSTDRSLNSMNRTFDPNSSMNKMNATFEETRNLLCQRSGCGKMFDSAFSLREHLNLEHNKHNNSNDNLNNEDHKCDICDINFISVYQLEDHFRTVHQLQQQPQETPLISTPVDNSTPFYENLLTDVLLPFHESINTTLANNDENLNSYNVDTTMTAVKIEQF